MGTSETPAAAEAQVRPSAAVGSAQRGSVLDRVLNLLSSARFGVVMLSILLTCCMIGMLVMQVEVDGFEEYYARITPSQRLIYGSLGFFNIYHSWYFNLLLAITGLNIILASIDRFPTAWQYVAKPKTIASPNFIRAQMFNAEETLSVPPAEAAESVKQAWRKRGLRPRVTEDKNRFTVFAQRNVWNRLGAYVVHVALLTLFTGGFLTSRYGVGGMMEIRPGRASSAFNTFEVSLEGRRVDQAFLPFSVECTDLQQKLIVPEGGLEAGNTIDWLSYIKVKDADIEIPAVVHLNNPFDYKGYRFFQSQFTPIGNARTVVVSFEPVGGGETRRVAIPRNGSVDVDGIGRVSYLDFYPDFEITDQGPGTISAEYNNPAAQLEIVAADGKRKGAFAFNPVLADRFYSRSVDSEDQNLLLVNGQKVILRDFEKVSLAHTLAVQYDPGRLPFYYGSTLLVLALCGVFFFSHQRFWAVIEPEGEGSRLFLGGNTNRNRPAFEERFNSMVQVVVPERRQL